MVFGVALCPPLDPPLAISKARDVVDGGKSKGKGTSPGPTEVILGVALCPPLSPPLSPPPGEQGGGGTRKGPRASTHSGRSGCSGSGIGSVDQGGVGAGAQGRREDPIEVTDAPPRLARTCGRRGLVRPRSSPEAPEGGGEPVQEVEGGATPTGGSCSPEPSLHPRHHAVRPRALLHL